MRNATEGLNLVAYAWGRANIGAGDVVVATEMEHHSNLVPWQFLANETGALMRYVRSTTTGRSTSSRSSASRPTGRVRLVAVVHVSNSLGTLNPIEELARWAHAHDAVLVVDGAQSAPHRPIDVQALGGDFFAFSGPQARRPVRLGRAVRTRVAPRRDGPVPDRRRDDQPGHAREHELERPAVQVRGGHAGDRRVHRLGAAIDYLTAVGIEAVAPPRARADDVRVRAPLDDPRPANPRARPACDRGAVLSFTLPDIHPHDLAAELDRFGIACAPATTARSPRCAVSVCRRRRGRASACTRCPRRSIGCSTESTSPG